MLRALRVLAYSMITLAMVAEIALAATLFFANRHDYRLVVITSGSMSPRYPVGSGLLIKKVDPDTLTPGTVVTFRGFNHVFTTHRIVAIHQIKGTEYLQTKGDNNPAPDPDFAPAESVIGTPVWYIPHGGYIAAFMTSPVGRLAIFGPPLALCLLIELRILRERLRVRRNTPDDGPDDGPDVFSDGPDAGPDTATTTGMPGGPTSPARPGQLKTSTGRTTHGFSTTVTTVITSIVLALSVATGLVVARSTARFIDQTPVNANAFTTTHINPPTALTATPGTYWVTLTWTPTTSLAATGYTVYRSTTATGPWTQIDTVAGRTTATYTDYSGVGTVYYALQATTSSPWTSANSTVVSTTRPVQVTGWANCTTNSADTGGDGNGYEGSPTRACGNPDSSYATDSKSGTGTASVCTDPDADRHRFGGYTLTVPINGVVNGVAVQAIAESNKSGSALCVDVSNDNGTTWSTPQKVSFTAVGVTQTLTFGGQGNLWGLTWTRTQINSQLMVRVYDLRTAGNGKFSLDSIQARAYY